MKRNWKRLLSSVLALVMVLAMLPASALAATSAFQVNSVSTASNSPVQINKKVTSNTDGTYTINMEAYVTGSVQPASAAPLDIVLVLDQSGSMKSNLSSLKTAVTNFVNAISENAKTYQVNHRVAIVGFASDETDGQSRGTGYTVSTDSSTSEWVNTGLFVNGKLKNYKIHSSEATYTPVYDLDKRGNSYYIQIDAQYVHIDHQREYGDHGGQWYYTTESDERPYYQRIYIEPKTSVSDSDSNHVQVYQRTWSSTETPLSAQDYKDALVSVNTSDSVTSSITTAISNLAASGATRASYGLEIAQQVFLNNQIEDGETRQRVVVFFTDGEPGGSGYDQTEANKAIAEAKTIKDTYSAKVYSVGLYSTASDNVTNFMNYVSSNYPDAESVNAPGDKVGDAEATYYKTANANTDLSSIFQIIAASIVASASVDGTSTLMDTVSDYFVLTGVETDNTGKVTSGVDVYTMSASGDGDDPTWTRDAAAPSVTVSMNGKEIQVTGFDYSADANVVVQQGTWQGKKLVISFKITPDTNYTEWGETGYYDTNATAQLSYGSDGDGTQLTQSPNAYVSTYAVTYSWGNNNITDQVPTDKHHYITGQKATVDSTTQKGSQITGSDGAKYKFNGWKQGNTSVSETVTIGSENIVLTADLSELYTVTYDPNGATGTTPTDSNTYAANEVVTVLGQGDLQKTGYTFNGWEITAPTTNKPTIDDDGKFNMPAANVTLTANWLKNLTVTVENETLPYDGTTQTSTKQPDVEGLPAGYTATVTGYTPASGKDVKEGGYTGSFDDNKSIKVEDSDGNDVTSQFTVTTWTPGTLTITPKSVTITVDDAEKFYGDSDPTFGGTVSGLVNENDLGTINYFRQCADQEAVGTYTDVLTASYAVNSNYNVEVNNGDFTIKTASSNEATLTATGGTWSYDGIPHAVSATLSPKAEELGYSIQYKVGDADWTTTAPSITDVGSMIVSVKATATGYEDLNNQATLTVTARPITLTANSASKTYDNTALIASGYTITSGSLVSGHEITGVTVTGSQTEVGSSANVISRTAEIKSGGSDKTANYKITYVDGTLTVNSIEVVPKPGLQVTKTLTSVNGKDYNGGKVEVKDALVWTITVTNTGDTRLANISVVDELTARGSIVVDEDSLPQNVNYENGMITISALGIGESETIYVSYTVLARDAGTTITNNVTVSAKNDDGSGPEHSNSSTVEVKDEKKKEEKPKLEVTKTVDNDNPRVGDTIEYTIVVENTGNVNLYDVTVSDELENAAGSIDVGKLPKGVTYNAKSDTFTIASLNEGDSVEITYTYKVLMADWCKELTNYVTVKGDGARDTDKVVVEVDEMLTPANAIIRPSLNTRDHVAYIIGYVDGTVRPENNITRSEVAAIFFRLLTDESRSFYWSQTNSYSDVDADDWFNNAVSTLSKAGVITGYTDGTFRPDQPITRAEFAAIAARFSDTVYSGYATFSDVPATYWAAQYISLAQHLGWVQGMPDGNFYPEKNITRAEAITMINRVLDRAVQTEGMLADMVTWTDNLPGAWYYEAIQEATNSHLYSRSFVLADGQDFFYEIWRSIQEAPDWANLEKAWSTANSK